MERQEVDSGTKRDGRAAIRVCPWWMGYLLASPLRRLFESPVRLLGPHVRPGMLVLEPGCAMGFFTLPLARMVGPEGRVVCVDLQQRMIARLRKRALAAGLADRIESGVCTAESLGLERWRGRIDLAVLIHVVHEVPDQAALFGQVHELLRPGGRLLVKEPPGHVSREAFAATAAIVLGMGLTEVGTPSDGRGRSGLWKKTEGA